MVARSLIPRLTDIIEAIERVNGVLAEARDLSGGVPKLRGLEPFFRFDGIEAEL